MANGTVNARIMSELESLVKSSTTKPLHLSSASRIIITQPNIYFAHYRSKFADVKQNLCLKKPFVQMSIRGFRRSDAKTFKLRGIFFYFR